MTSDTNQAPSGRQSSTSAASSTSKNQNKSSGSLGAGTKAGIAIGAIAGCILLGLILWLVYRHGKRQSMPRRLGWHSSEKFGRQDMSEISTEKEQNTSRRPHELLEEERPIELGSTGVHELESRGEAEL